MEYGHGHPDPSFGKHRWLDVANDGRTTVENLRQQIATGSLEGDDRIIAWTLNYNDGSSFGVPDGVWARLPALATEA